MSNHRDPSKQRRNDHLLKNLPTEVLLKARSTLVSLGGVLKPKQEQQQQRSKAQKELKDKKNQDRLKSSRSEPEFSEVRKNKHRSRLDDPGPRTTNGGGGRPRPLSVGATKRYDNELEDFKCGSFPKDTSPLHIRQFDPMEEICVQSRLVIPVAERLNPDVQTQEVSERPRKKLSFREPEIVGSGSATLGRSHKLMGVNSLTQRPNRVSLRSDMQCSSLEGLDSDLECEAMRIVRSVGQAFEVCHKMQSRVQKPAPSTSSASSQPVPSQRSNNASVSKEGASDCGASDTAGASTSKAQEEIIVIKEEPGPVQIELLPPPPRKEGGKRAAQRTTPTPSINLIDLPECETKVEAATDAADVTTPLSAQHQLQLLRERLEQQAQQTNAVVAQLLLVRDQLAAEQSARVEAQTRTHQLLVHNRELLDHIAALVAHLQDREHGSPRPISAQQLTLLPQKEGVNDATSVDITPSGNNNFKQITTEPLIHIVNQPTKANQSLENNNLSFSPFTTSPVTETTNGPSFATTFGGMTNDQIQNYLISKFDKMGGFSNEQNTAPANNNPLYYQNSTAFPHIPPLNNNLSNNDLVNLLNQNVNKGKSISVDELGQLTQAMSVGQSDNSLYSSSQPTSSKDSSPDASSSEDGNPPFIMPLSHNGTLRATDGDGRVRIIVPVSPSDSVSDVVELHAEPQPSMGATLTVPAPAPNRLEAPAAPITRTTSEKVPNRSEMMTALRAQWTRHTTK